MLTSLPKVELHLHLEGSLRPGLVLELARRNGVDLGTDDPDVFAERYAFRDFLHFIELFKDGLEVLRWPEDLLAAADALTDELAEQNVRWAEITTTAVAHLGMRGWSAYAYAEVLDEAALRARAKGVGVGWIVDVARGMELPEDDLSVGFLTGANAPKDAVAMGLGGPEAEWPPERYEATFAKARAAGVPAVIHAGEVAGPSSVRGALDVLKAVRIGHGVRSIEDPLLLGRLVDEQVPVEVSPTSNVLLGVAPTIEAHPFGAMLQAGVNVSVNSDDPGYFSTTLTRELELVVEHHGVDDAGLVDLQRRAADAALCPPEVRSTIHAQLDAWEAGDR